jgi:acetyltransferase-like isoleucine patch superfamily enzyme
MAIPILKMATVGMMPSPLKVFYYRLKGAKIGKRVSIGLFSVLDCKTIEIGDDSKIGHFSFIKARVLKLNKRVKINTMVAIETGEVEIDNDAVIMEQVVVGGMLSPRSKIKIGKRVKIFPYSFLNPTEPITIEDDVGIGGANYIFTHGSWQSILDGFPVSFGPVTIKKGVWFPWRVFVMPNVTVGEYATIGAGSIITKDIPARSLAAGSPAKVLRTDKEYIKEYSFEEKREIVKKILKEFSEFQSYNGQKVSSVFYADQITEMPDFGAVVSLKKIDEALKLKMNDKNIIWFDLENKNTFFHRNEKWKDLKDFFSRYGVKFEIES